MVTHVSPARFSDIEAAEIYKELGELTEVEMRQLLHNHTDTTRNTYFRNIYGYAAGAHARRVFSRWRAQHECLAGSEANCADSPV